MKFESRKDHYGKNTVLISHNGLTIFVNQRATGYQINVTAKLTNGETDIWESVGRIDLTPQQLEDWTDLLKTLPKMPTS